VGIRVFFSLAEGWIIVQLRFTDARPGIGRRVPAAREWWIIKPFETLMRPGVTDA